MLFTFAEYFLQINFISLDALSRNSEQIKLSEFLKRNKRVFLVAAVVVVVVYMALPGTAYEEQFA